MTKRLTLLLVALAVAVGLPGQARAHEDGAGRSGDNAAIAINTKDGSSLFKFAFSLRKVAGDIVDNQNAAVAYASCERCQTTAIAIQIVLVTGSPSTVVPENYAISINENCTACRTFSAAFQFVIGVEDPSVGLSREGQRELKQIIREFKALKRENYTLEEFDAKTRALADRIRTVLRTQLVSRRDGGDGEDDQQDEREEDERPAPPQPPPATGTEGETTSPPTATETTPATTETAPVETEPPPPPPTTTETMP